MFTDADMQFIRRLKAGQIAWDDLPVILQDTLFEFFQPNMPYTIQKARDDDPVNWMTRRLHWITHDGPSHVLPPVQALAEYLRPSP